MPRKYAGGSRDAVPGTGWWEVARSGYAQRPGIGAPAGQTPLVRRRGPGRSIVAYNTMAGVAPARSFPGEGPEFYPGERNNATPRLARLRAEPHIPFRIQRGADWDPQMPALTLGLPWRPAPDSPPARRGGRGSNQ